MPAVPAPLPPPAPRRRPRIARRFVPRHSLAITLDWDLTPSEKVCLTYLLSKPRDGAVIHGVSAGEIAAATGYATRTARSWLHGLEDMNYLAVRPGRRRGSLVITLAPKATRWLQFGPGDLQRKEERKSRILAQRPLCAPSRQKTSASKGMEKEKEAGAREEAAAPPARAPTVPTADMLARMKARAEQNKGLLQGAYFAQVYAQALALARRAAPPPGESNA